MTVARCSVFLIIGLVLGEFLALTGIVGSQVVFWFSSYFSPNWFLAAAYAAAFIIATKELGYIRLFSGAALFTGVLGFWLVGDGGVRVAAAASFLPVLFGVFYLTFLNRASETAFEKLSAIIILPLFVLCSSYYLELSKSVFPVTYDALFYRIDGIIFPGISEFWFEAGREYSYLKLLCVTVYVALPVAVGILYCLQTEKERSSGGVVTLFVMTAFWGYLLYVLFPASGPIYLFGQQYPDVIAASAVDVMKSLAPPAPRNAMPSLHTSWVLLLFINAISKPIIWRCFFGVFAVVTLVATLLLGEHYVIDLVMAIPFVLAIQLAYREGLDSVRNKVTFAASVFVWAVWFVLQTSNSFPLESYWSMLAIVLLSSLGPVIMYFLWPRSIGTASTNLNEAPLEEL